MPPPCPSYPSYPFDLPILPILPTLPILPILPNPPILPIRPTHPTYPIQPIPSNLSYPPCSRRLADREDLGEWLAHLTRLVRPSATDPTALDDSSRRESRRESLRRDSFVGMLPPTMREFSQDSCGLDELAITSRAGGYDLGAGGNRGQQYKVDWRSGAASPDLDRLRSSTMADLVSSKVRPRSSSAALHPHPPFIPPPPNSSPHLAE